MEKAPNRYSFLIEIGTKFALLVLPFALLRLLLVNTGGNHLLASDFLVFGFDLTALACVIAILYTLDQSKRDIFYSLTLLACTIASLYYSYTIIQTGALEPANPRAYEFWEWIGAIPNEVYFFIVMPVVLYLLIGQRAQSATRWNSHRLRIALAAATLFLAVIATDRNVDPHESHKDWRNNGFVYASTFDIFFPRDDNDWQRALDRKLGNAAFLNHNIRPSTQYNRDANVILINLDGISGSLFDNRTNSKGFARTRKFLTENSMLFNHVYETSTQRIDSFFQVLCGHQKFHVESFTMAAEKAETLDCLPKIAKANGMRTYFIDGKLRVDESKTEFLSQVGITDYIDESEFKQESLAEFKPYNTYQYYTRVLSKLNMVIDRPGRFFVVVDAPEFAGLTEVPLRWQSEAKGATPWERRVDFFDYSLSRFLAVLNSSPVMRNTLVVLVGSNIANSNLPMENAIYNWVPFALMGPDISYRGVVHDAHPKSDIALTVMDYLEFRHGGFAVTGRSMLREYNEPRYHFWVNRKDHSFELFEPNGKRTSCTAGVRRCKFYRSYSDRFLEVSPTDRDRGDLPTYRNLFLSYFGKNYINSVFADQVNEPVAH